MLQELADLIVYQWMGIAPGSRLGDAVDFFFYDTMKIFLLLVTIIFVVAIIRSYFPPERAKKLLSHKREYVGNLLAALLGIVTPF
ncbi:MAG: permease, partial [Negativicutes bacterium]|nr:permease [Negativicutes bacterium]